MIRFNIEEKLESKWEPIIVRQLHLLLSPVFMHVKYAHIKFETQYDEASDIEYYYCELSGHGLQNEVFNASTKNTDGKVAVHDVFSRVRRSIIRANKHASVNDKVVSILAKQPRTSVLSDF